MSYTSLVHSFFSPPGWLCYTFFFACTCSLCRWPGFLFHWESWCNWRRASASSHHCSALTSTLNLLPVPKDKLCLSLCHHSSIFTASSVSSLSWIIPTSIHTYSFLYYSLKNLSLCHFPLWLQPHFSPSFLSQVFIRIVYTCKHLSYYSLLNLFGWCFCSHDSTEYILIKDVDHIPVTEPTGQFHMSSHFDTFDYFLQPQALSPLVSQGSSRVWLSACRSASSPFPCWFRLISLTSYHWRKPGSIHWTTFPSRPTPWWAHLSQGFKCHASVDPSNVDFQPRLPPEPQIIHISAYITNNHLKLNCPKLISGGPGWRSRGDLRHILLIVNERSVRGKNHIRIFKASALIISAHIPVTNTHHVTKSKVSETGSTHNPGVGGKRSKGLLINTPIHHANTSQLPSKHPRGAGFLWTWLSQLDTSERPLGIMPAWPKQHFSFLSWLGVETGVHSHPGSQPSNISTGNLTSCKGSILGP